MAVRIQEIPDAGALSGSEQVEVSTLSSTILISAGTISAQGSDNSYNDSADGFLTAGFDDGMSVNVQGFTGNVANNIYTGRITSVTAGKMVIGGTDGDVIVDDAAGESVTISQWVTRRTTVQGIANLFSNRVIQFAASGEEQLLATGTSVIKLRAPFAMTVTEVRASLSDPQTSGAVLTFDINRNGTSILSTKLTVDNNETSSLTAVTAAVLSGTTIDDDDEISIDIDQIGNGTAAGLKIAIIGF